MPRAAAVRVSEFFFDFGLCISIGEYGGKSGHSEDLNVRDCVGTGRYKMTELAHFGA